jgi:FtsH-binding integral membrane protein
VLLLSLLINRISFAAAAGLFLVYAVSLGLTLSAIFLVYTYSSIFSTFLVASGMFGAMALYGYFTKADLSAMGSFLFMALIGLILGGLVNMFFKSESFNYVLSAIGVIVFTLLTAYDVQKIKQMASGLYEDSDSMAKASILGALTLYLDFVNLFLYLLQIMGRRRE